MKRYGVTRRGPNVDSASESLFRPPTIFRCPQRTVLDDTPDNTIWPGHYVLIPVAGRKSFVLFDAPIGLSAPWINGPEMTYDAVTASLGPHSGGFFYSNGFQQGVGFMLQVQDIR